VKKTIRVVIEKEYEIELKDNILTQENIKEFESYMWELDGDTLEAKQEELFKFAARQIAEYDVDFVEGLGNVCKASMVGYYERNGAVMNVVWNDTYEDVETEVVG
jgi:hypothetical protein